jgi:hypothetical protein
VNYTEIKDTCLVWAWSQVSIDAVAGNDQTEKRYWQQIEDKFFKCMPQVTTSIAPIDPYKIGGMRSKEACCSRWSETMEQVRNSPPSGISTFDHVSAFQFALIL